METSTIVDKNWKALIKPDKLDITSNEDKTVANVVAEPLEKGFGQTIGNSLRRILLSSIQGAAVTGIQIDGVLHEFSSIKGVREDVTDIVLNVKSLAIKSTSKGAKKIILDVYGIPFEKLDGFRNQIEYKGILNYKNRLEVMSQYDFLIIASRSEGMPMILIECLSIGLPFITTKVGAINDTLIQNYPYIC